MNARSHSVTVGADRWWEADPWVYKNTLKFIAARVRPDRELSRRIQDAAQELTLDLQDLEASTLRRVATAAEEHYIDLHEAGPVVLGDAGLYDLWITELGALISLLCEDPRLAHAHATPSRIQLAALAAALEESTREALRALSLWAVKFSDAEPLVRRIVDELPGAENAAARGAMLLPIEARERFMLEFVVSPREPLRFAAIDVLTPARPKPLEERDKLLSLPGWMTLLRAASKDPSERVRQRAATCALATGLSACLGGAT